MVRSLAGLLTERKDNVMLGENSLVVVESIPKLVSEVIELSKREVTPLFFREPARFIGEYAKRVEGIALD
jgi:hypothetical protein